MNVETSDLTIMTRLRAGDLVAMTYLKELRWARVTRREPGRVRLDHATVPRFLRPLKLAWIRPSKVERVIAGAPNELAGFFVPGLAHAMRRAMIEARERRETRVVFRDADDWDRCLVVPIDRALDAELGGWERVVGVTVVPGSRDLAVL